MPNRLALPSLYVILDQELLPSDPLQMTHRMLDAGVRLFQYRNKFAPAREVLQTTQALSIDIPQRGAIFIVNDRPDIARLAGAGGVHLGQDDVAASAARKIVGRDAVIGVSTHNLEQFKAAADSEADYLAVGPIFPTGSKRNPDPAVGTALLRQARDLTAKPIVAIGGITLENVREVIEAGARSVAVISDILTAKDPIARARQFLEILSTVTDTAGN